MTSQLRNVGLGGIRLTLEQQARSADLAPTVRQNGIEIAAYDNAMPTAERLQHGRFTEEAVFSRSKSRPQAFVVRCQGTVERLRRAHVLTRPHVTAAYEFSARFHTASLDPMRAAPMERQSRGPQSDTHQERVETARNWINAAVKQMGGPESLVATCVYYVCGLGMTLKEYATVRIGPYRISCNPRTSVGLLVGGLTILASWRTSA